MARKNRGAASVSPQRHKTPPPAARPMAPASHSTAKPGNAPGKLNVIARIYAPDGSLRA
jgi:hypothetical protein